MERSPDDRCGGGKQHRLVGFASLEGEELFLTPAGGRCWASIEMSGNGRSVADHVMDEDRRGSAEQVLPAVARDGRWDGETRFKHRTTGAPIPMWQSIFFITEQGTNRRIAMATIAGHHGAQRDERYQHLSAEILGVLNEPLGLRDAVGRILTAIKRETGFDAVGIRLRSGDDFPYFVRTAFRPIFLAAENSLIGRGENGKIGLECTCGLVLSGADRSGDPLFTKDGSFWTNDSPLLLDAPAGQAPGFIRVTPVFIKGYRSEAPDSHPRQWRDCWAAAAQ